MSKWHGGKGSAPRKGSDQKSYEDNWDRIFGKKDAELELQNKALDHVSEKHSDVLEALSDNHDMKFTTAGDMADREQAMDELTELGQELEDYDSDSRKPLDS